MMSIPWSWFFNSHTLLGRPSHGLHRNIFVIVARGAEEEHPSPLKAIKGGDASSIAIGVIFCLFILALIALAGYYFFKNRKQHAGDMEAGASEKRNWWMVDDKDEKKNVDWWRLSHQIPARVEPPKSATATRTSLQRLKSALNRKGALKGANREASPPKVVSTIPSPTLTLDLPMQVVPQTKHRYPSVLERGYRVPLYPVQSPPKDNSPPRSLTSPNPIIIAERNARRKISLPPRALKISNGRPILNLTERKTGVPRSPANRRRDWLVKHQFRHPFLPLKDTDTTFPTISAPMPSSETELTNSKLGYAYSMSKPRAVPSFPNGPRLARQSTRRVPVPLYERPPLLPITPFQLREETRVLPPGQSPQVPRTAPTPI